jgi:sugar lactone lactonase YvrE
MLIRRREFLAIVSVAPALAKLDIRRAEVETVFDSPGPKPNGLQATDEGLWILDQGDNRVYLVSYEEGKVLRNLATDTKSGSGITFDGSALWTASTYSREILKIDAQSGKTLAHFDSPGSGVVAWTTPRSSPLAPPAKPVVAPRPPQRRNATGAHGMEWRDGKLWVSVPPAQMIYRLDPKTFQIEKQFPTAGDRPHGLGWQGKWLWCAESNENAFFRFDPETGKADAKIQLTDADPLPHGMTIRDGWMWYCDDVGIVCRLRLDR